MSTTSVRADTIGTAWLEVARLVLDDGRRGYWRGAPLREVLRVEVAVTRPAPEDPVITRYADPARLAWMHSNFTDPARVAELGDADSYATRLYDYARSGRDQIAWAVARLRADPWCRDATITTFQPLTDTSYVPCISLLDLWLEERTLQLAVYAHGIDVGTKGYANLVELADLQRRVAGELGAGVGTLTVSMKSAHVYDTELDLVRGIVDDAP